MNKQSLLVLLPVLAFGACAQPETVTEKPVTVDMTVETAEVAVNQTVVLAITGAS
jgi:uncharacterized lipoprotein YajG